MCRKASKKTIFVSFKDRNVLFGHCRLQQTFEERSASIIEEFQPLPALTAESAEAIERVLDLLQARRSPLPSPADPEGL